MLHRSRLITVGSLGTALALLSSPPVNAEVRARATDTVEALVVDHDTKKRMLSYKDDPRWLDYGSRHVLPLAAGDLARVSSVDGVRRVAYSAELGGESLDLQNWSPGTRPAPWPLAPQPADQLGLLQFVSPPRAAWIQQLEALGLRVVRVIQPYLVVVWGPLETSEAPDLEPVLRHVGRFEPEFRLAPELRHLNGGTTDVRLLVVRYAAEQVVRTGLARHGAIVTGWQPLDRSLVSVTLRADAARLPEIANSPGVYAVHLPPTDGGLRGEMSNQVHVGNVDGMGLAFPGYQAWLSNLGADGSGVTIANVDTGVDEDHPDLTSRMLDCVGFTCSSAASGHGTHTAGIMAGDGTSGSDNGGGFLRGLGVAPGAHLFEQVYTPWFTQAGGMRLLMYESHANGADFSGNSWGPAGSPRGYDDDTMQVDIGVRDADPFEDGHQALPYVLSFMNGYGGKSSQGTPDEAKNLINVGSTKAQSTSTTQNPDIDDLSANSAHGPALDGRTIPHLVAPGCSVDSTEPNGAYGLRCGTSMASPHVSGTIALFLEQFRAEHGTEPSPALIKAALLATARSLAGHEDADGGLLGHPFDSKQGWGRNDPAALLLSPTVNTFHDQLDVFDDSGQVWQQTWSVDDPTQPVRLMLVWTDAPGHGLGGNTPAWNNDLDLEVSEGGTIYRGNWFGTDGWSVPGGAPDPMNNTEGVFLPAAPQRSEITIRIIAADVSSDGVPDDQVLTDQDFALWCTNCVPFEAVIFANGFESGDTEAW